MTCSFVASYCLNTPRCPSVPQSGIGTLVTCFVCLLCFCGSLSVLCVARVVDLMLTNQLSSGQQPRAVWEEVLHPDTCRQFLQENGPQPEAQPDKNSYATAAAAAQSPDIDLPCPSPSVWVADEAKVRAQSIYRSVCLSTHMITFLSIRCHCCANQSFVSDGRSLRNRLCLSFYVRHLGLGSTLLSVRFSAAPSATRFISVCWSFTLNHTDILKYHTL